MYRFSSDWGSIDRNFPGTVKAAHMHSTNPAINSITTCNNSNPRPMNKHRQTPKPNTNTIMHNRTGIENYTAGRTRELLISDLQQGPVCEI